jgi:hypothetical protein
MQDELLAPMPIGPFFRFPDEETGWQKLTEAGLTTISEDGKLVPITASHHHALDVIGPICTGGSYDPESGDVIEPPVLLEGWHINYIGSLPDGWEQYAVHPKRPKRVFA